jgi:L-fucose isomerase-like protein
MRISNHKIKVGIRPTIDGRLGGVRESLENQTLSLAKAAAKLISSSLNHRDGSTLECIIPEKCIGGAAESSETDSLFARENVGLTLTVTPCWCYGSETMDMDPLRPKAVWGFQPNWRLSFGLDLFDGPPDGLFGQYADKDRVYAEVRYDF